MKSPTIRKAGTDAILIRFVVQETRHALYPGLKFSSQTDHKKALGIVKQIEADVLNGCFDESLCKYKINSKLDKKTNSDSIQKLLYDYLEIKKSTIKWRTYIDYHRLLKIIQKYKDYPPNKVLHLLETDLRKDYSDESRRKIQVLLKACFRYWKQRKIISENPLEDIDGIKKTKRKKRPEYFTQEEKDLIIDEFMKQSKIVKNKKPKIHPIYCNLVQFIFSTGCRPEEACGLRLCDYSAKTNLLTFQNIYHRGELVPGLKTQEKRQIKLNLSAQIAIDEAIKNKKDNDFIFGIDGEKPINWVYFNKYVWIPVIRDKLKLLYRVPYSMRHSFITWMLQKNIPVQEIANYCGNSPEIIYKHYAGVTDNFEMPEV